MAFSSKIDGLESWSPGWPLVEGLMDLLRT